MKLTNRQIVQAVPAINVLNTLKLPVKASFNVAKTSRALDIVLEDYNKTLKKLQEEHAKRNKKGEMVTKGDQIQFKNPEAFNKAFGELMDLESDVRVRKVKLEELGNVEVTPAVLYQLEWLLEDELDELDELDEPAEA